MIFLQDSERGEGMLHHRAEVEPREANQEALDPLLCPEANHCLKHVAFLYCENGILPYPRVPWFMLSEQWD